MARSLLGCAVAVLALAAPAAAGLPRGGALVPGQSLGGVRLGEPASSVRAALGKFYGVCRGCSRPTWYFTYGEFDKHGLAVELERGRVAGVYTLWQPAGWHAPRGLRLGATPLEVHRKVGTLRTVTCSGYDALVRDKARARTVYYVFDGRLWAFGLFRRGATPCR
jgi:hypothetical protein